MLNVSRLNMKQTYAFMRGMQFARGGQLPLEVFDAVAMSEEEAAMVQMDVNVQRAINESLSRMRGR